MTTNFIWVVVDKNFRPTTSWQHVSNIPPSLAQPYLHQRAVRRGTSLAFSAHAHVAIGVWTLIFGALLRVEKFTIKKLIGVFASLAGIVLISSIDITGNQDENRGSFPHKSHKEIAIGDTLAFTSAIMYGIYTTLMKKRIGDESRVDMPLFFGFVGMFNIITLLPGFFILHFTGIETFELPPTKRILAIVLVSDF